MSRSVALSLLLGAAIVNSACGFRIQTPGATVVAPDDTDAPKPSKPWIQMFQDKIGAAADAAQDRLGQLQETEHYKNAKAKLQDVHAGISENIEYLQKEFEKQTPAMKAKFQANIDGLKTKLAELRQSESARLEQIKADLSKGIMELKENVPPETMEKVKGSFDSMANKLAELQESDSYKAGSAKWNEIERSIARNLDEVQKKVEDATPETRAKVQETIDRLRERLKELQSQDEKASPEPAVSALLELAAPDDTDASEPAKSWAQIFQEKLAAAADAAQARLEQLQEIEHYKNAKAKLQEMNAGLSDTIEELKKKLAEADEANPAVRKQIEKSIEILQQQSDWMLQETESYKMSINKLGELQEGISEDIEYLQKEFADQTPEMKGKFQANIDSLKKKLAELQETESARLEEIKADVSRGIMELTESVPPETMEKVKGSFDSMGDQLAELQESDTYKAGSAKLNEIERGIARNLDEVQKKVEDATPEVKAKVQKTIDSLREKLKELQSSDEKA